MHDSLLEDIIHEEKNIDARVHRIKERIRGRLDLKQAEIEETCSRLKRQLHNSGLRSAEAAAEQILKESRQQQDTLEERLAKQKSCSDESIRAFLSELLLEKLRAQQHDHQDGESGDSRPQGSGNRNTRRP